MVRCECIVALLNKPCMTLLIVLSNFIQKYEVYQKVILKLTDLIQNLSKITQVGPKNRQFLHENKTNIVIFNFGQHFEQPTSIYGCLIEQTPA